jgi:hypothetical protein
MATRARLLQQNMPLPRTQPPHLCGHREMPANTDRVENGTAAIQEPSPVLEDPACRLPFHDQCGPVRGPPHLHRPRRCHGFLPEQTQHFSPCRPPICRPARSTQRRVHPALGRIERIFLCLWNVFHDEVGWGLGFRGKAGHGRLIGLRLAAVQLSAWAGLVWRLALKSWQSHCAIPTALFSTISARSASRLQCVPDLS